MKKSAIAVLLALTLTFAAFVAGFYIGRNYNRGNILISGINKITNPNSTPDTQHPTFTTVPATLDETSIQLLELINAATLEIWDQVPGIGELTAQSILDYRKEYGNFEKPEDLLNVSGIGPKTLDKIMDYFSGRLHDEDIGS